MTTAGRRCLTSEVEIAAPPEAVWAVLTDFASFPEWNPFVVEASGDVAVGARLRVRIRPDGGRATTFRPTVTVVEPARRLGWLGRLLVPGLFDGAHRFELEQTATGTRLVQAEEFSGILAGLILSMVGAASLAGFQAMNEAIKTRVESMHPVAAVTSGRRL